MISIALCTYNGEKYLLEQLGSIAQQNHLPDELIVCDDGSSDETLSILDKFARTAPFEVRTVRNETNLGPSRNFAKAVKLCKGEWIFFCDQDDRWLPDKIKLTVSKLAQMSESLGAQTPLLVHTDAIVADNKLEEIHPSLWEFQHCYPHKGHQIGKLLNQNLVTGCTAVINQALRDKALPIPDGVMMHDWWLALVASAFGKIDIVPQATIFYRQHGLNDTGAKAWGLSEALSSLLDIRNRNYILKTNKEISRRIRKQASVFLQTYFDELSQEQKSAISAFIELPNRSYFVRKYSILKYGLHYQGLLRNLGNLLLK